MMDNVYLRNVDKEGIKYLMSHGGMESINLVRTVNDLGEDSNRYCGICQSYYLDSSTDSIIFDKKICDELLNINHATEELLFYLLGYRNDWGEIFIRDIYYPCSKPFGDAVKESSKTAKIQANKASKRYSKYGNPVLLSCHNHTVTSSPHKDAFKLVNNLSLADLVAYKTTKSNLSKGLMAKILSTDVYYGCLMINQIGDITVIREDENGRLEKFDKIKFLDSDKIIKDIRKYEFYDENVLGNYTNVKDNYEIAKTSECFRLIDKVINEHKEDLIII